MDNRKTYRSYGALKSGGWNIHVLRYDAPAGASEMMVILSGMNGDAEK
jgi:hypothetical protein